MIEIRRKNEQIERIFVLLHVKTTNTVNTTTFSVLFIDNVIERLNK